GGRYNGLVESIGGPDQPGVGLGLGLERTVMLLENQQADWGDLSRVDVYLVGLGEAAERETVKLLQQLRNRGIAAERDYLGRKMKAQMKSADRYRVRFTAILGEDELAKGEITLKDMSNGEQRQVSLTGLADEILASSQP
ncbi:His/Gly/Thr/Pro-type tRNA ligase C-terminal domain-containing protein, partial [Paenibacillus darwinianus]